MYQSHADSSEHLVMVFRELDVVTDWVRLGSQLGLYPATLQEIKEDEQSTSHRKMAMLHQWLKLRDGVKAKGGATKDSLVKALYTMKQNKLAHKIDTKGLNPFQSPPPTRELHITFMSIYHIATKF